MILSKDAPVAEHVHDKEVECLAILRGDGDLILAGEPHPLGPGKVTCIPAGAKHAWKPKGTAPLVAIQLYSPAGPEQRFKKLAAPKP
jgi:mannose-6-phosphate isomerase-like protein (cupin superfamily)